MLPQKKSGGCFSREAPQTRCADTPAEGALERIKLKP
jgi:hypothetical protein